MRIKKLFEKLKNNKEFRDYVIWGIIALAVNIGLFKILESTGIEYRTANIITLVFNRIFCYVTNKLFVFHTRCRNIWELLKEFLTFILARMITFLMDYFGVILLVEVIGIDTFISKLITSFIVIVSNYIFSKLLVFRHKKD